MPGDGYSIGLLALIALMAVLYSSVGHGGASGYLAAMTLFGLAPGVMKPAALTMNIFVSALVLYRLSRARHFDWRLFMPFASASVPMAFLGGAFQPSDTTYRLVVGAALLIAGVRLVLRLEHDGPTFKPQFWLAMPAGALLGFVAGMTGVGGGIFLSPLLLLLRWTTMRANAAIAAGFILVNSIAGLSGYAYAGAAWPEGLAWLVTAALAGAVVGSELAVRRVPPFMLRKMLGVVLLVAAFKMFVAA